MRAWAIIVLMVAVGVGMATRALAGPADPDPGFGTGGLLVTHLTSDATLSSVDDLEVDPQGRLVVAGRARRPGMTDAQFTVARFLPDGAPDPSFAATGATPGAQVLDLDPNGSFARALALDASGRIYVVGDEDTRAPGAVVARLTADGTVDTTFNPSGARPGVVFGVGGAGGAANAVRIDGAGRAVVAGGLDVGTSSQPFVARFSQNGALDATFAPTATTPGVATLAVGDGAPRIASAQGLALAADGSVTLGGLARFAGRARFMLLRFSADGTHQQTATTSFDGAAGDSTARSVVVDGAGRPTLAGVTTELGTPRVALARFTIRGVLDPTFGTGGRLTQAVGPNSAALELLPGPDGTLLAVGGATAGGFVARYTAAGAPDPSFDAGVSNVRTYAPASGTASFAAAAPVGGLLLVAGSTGDRAILGRIGGAAEAPRPAFSFAPVTPVAGKPIRPGQPLQFVSETRPASSGAQIVRTQWDLDQNGSFEIEGQTVVGSIFSTDNPAVTLRVTDELGLAGTTAMTIPVVANVAPTSAFTPPGPRAAPSPPALPDEPTVNVLYGIEGSASSDPDGSVRQWAWDVDDDGFFENRGSQNRLDMRFNRVGKRRIGLLVTDDERLESPLRATRDVTVVPANFEIERVAPKVGQTLDVNAGGTAVARFLVRRGPGSLGPLTALPSQPKAVGVSAATIPALPASTTAPAVQEFEIPVKADSAAGEGERLADVDVTSTFEEGAVRRSVALPIRVLPGYDAAIQGIEVTQGTQDDLSHCHLEANVASLLLPPDHPDQSNKLCLSEPSLSVGAQGPKRLTARYAGVPLVTEKATIARVFASTFGARSAQKFTATLTGRRDGKTLGTITPVSAPAALRLDSQRFVTYQERDDDTNAIAFVLPPSWTKATKSGVGLELQADLVPAAQAKAESQNECTQPICAADNRFVLERVPFVDPGSLQIGFVRIYTDNENKVSGFSADPDYHINQGIRSAPDGSPVPQRRWPSIGDLSEYTTTLLPLGEGRLQFPAQYMGDYNWTDLIKSVADRTDRRIATRDRLADRVEDFELCFESCPAQIYGAGSAELMSGGVSRGNFLGDDVHVSVGRANSPTTATHELLHGWDIAHSHGSTNCTTPGQEGEAIDANGFGFMDGVKLDPRGWLPGRSKAKPFVVRAPSVDSEGRSDLFDVMSYCADEGKKSWIAPDMWRKALAQRMKRGRAGGPSGPGGLFRSIGQPLAALRQAGGSVLAVHAVDRRGEVVVTEVSRRPRARKGTDVGSTYVAEVRDAAGAVLASAPMRAEAIDEAPGTGLDAEIPAPPTASSVVVMRAGAEAGRRDASPTAPTVAVTSPTRRTVVRGALRVAWRATDADGPRPLASVAYSADGGRTWRNVAETTDGSITVPRKQLAPSRRALVRVKVSDGFREAETTSRPFVVPPAPPTVEIRTPGRGGRATAGAPLVLGGYATADGGTPLPGRALTWWVGRRMIGRGSSVSATGLAPGTAIVRLVARGAGGRTAQVRRAVRIAPVPVSLTTLAAPKAIRRGARRVKLRVASTFPTALRIGAQRFRVTPRRTSIVVRVKPGVRALRLNLRLGRGPTKATGRVVIDRR